LVERSSSVNKEKRKRFVEGIIQEKKVVLDNESAIIETAVPLDELPNRKGGST
jgi:hypothetical protein